MDFGQCQLCTRVSCGSLDSAKFICLILTEHPAEKLPQLLPFPLHSCRGRIRAQWVAMVNGWKLLLKLPLVSPILFTAIHIPV